MTAARQGVGRRPGRRRAAGPLLAAGLAALVLAGACATLRRLDDAAPPEPAPSRPVPADFDTGQYGAVVLEDPADKQAIQGFVDLSLVSGTRLRPAYPRAVAALAEAINADTRLQARVAPHVDLTSSDLHRQPFLYISAAEAFDLSPVEVDNLSRYLHGGGFVVADNGRPDLSYGPAEASLRKLLIDAAGPAAQLASIPDDHDIYRSYYELSGPPFGGDYRPGFDTRQRPPRAEALEGVSVDGRLVAVYSDMGYGGFWQQPFENEPQLRMGINLVVFALTRDGSPARRLPSDP